MTEESLDHILAQCLDEAERTGDIDAVLQAHPEHADELRPLLELATMARDLYAEPPPPPGGLTWGRARVLSQADSTRRETQPQERESARRQGESPNSSRLPTLLVGAGVAAAVAAFSLVSFVRAVDGAVPGHRLYRFDRTVEQVRLGLSRNTASATQLRLCLAEERLREVAQLVRADDQTHLQEALEAYDQAVFALAQMPAVSRSASDPPSSSILDRELARHEELLQAALEGSAGQGAAEPSAGEKGDTHPLVVAMARHYGVDADTVMDWSCDSDYGYGQIMHALQTSVLMSSMGVLDDTAPGTLLTLRARLGGWGGVWRVLGVFGQPDKPEPPGLTSTLQTPARTSTPMQLAPTNTPQQLAPTDTPQPSAPTDTPQPSAPTSTSEQLAPASTPQPPGLTKTPQPPGLTKTAQPLGLTKSPEAPGQIKKGD